MNVHRFDDRKYLNNVSRFVGELFKLRAVSAKVIHESITRLLNQSDNEDSLECLCRLLTTIGKELMLCLEQPMSSDASNTSCSTKPKVVLHIIVIRSIQN